KTSSAGRVIFQAGDGIRDRNVTGVQTCALPICLRRRDAPGPLIEDRGASAAGWAPLQASSSCHSASDVLPKGSYAGAILHIVQMGDPPWGPYPSGAPAPASGPRRSEC